MVYIIDGRTWVYPFHIDSFLIKDNSMLDHIIDGS
jgi:hypothetical protein